MDLGPIGDERASGCWDPAAVKGFRCEAAPPSVVWGRGDGSPLEEAETAARCGVKVPVLEGARRNSFPEFRPSDPSTTRAPRTRPHLKARRPRWAASRTL
jgi:hypothetical protein